MTSIASLVLAAAVAQAAVAPPRDPAALPEGTPEDQQLWRQLREVTNLTTVGMGRIAQCSFRISYGRYYENLDQALKEGAEPERAEAKALREALAAEAKAADAASPERPGLRDCQYVLRDLGLQMPLLSEAVMRKAIAGTRREARACLKRLKPLSEKLLVRADALEGALAAVDVFQAKRLGAVAVPAGAGAPDTKEPAAAPAGGERAPAAAADVPAASSAPQPVEARP